MRNIPVSASKFFTADQVAGFNYTAYLPTCQGITSDQLLNFTASAYSGFTAGCIALLSPASTFQYISGAQLSQLSVSACGGLQPQQLAYITPLMIRAFSLQQLGGIS